LTNDIFSNIFHQTLEFPSEKLFQNFFGENFNISENNMIGVELGLVLGYLTTRMDDSQNNTVKCRVTPQEEK
jgi:hypothetical protein